MAKTVNETPVLTHGTRYCTRERLGFFFSIPNLPSLHPNQVLVG
jgi:hypothetical protein